LFSSFLFLGKPPPQRLADITSSEIHQEFTEFLATIPRWSEDIDQEGNAWSVQKPGKGVLALALMFRETAKKLVRNPYFQKFLSMLWNALHGWDFLKIYGAQSAT